MNIMTKDRVLKLYDANITKREYDAILQEIDNRVNHIWRRLLEISYRNMAWYKYANHDGSNVGSFDPKSNRDFIKFDGDYDVDRDIYGKFDNGFPTRFLWTKDDLWKDEVLDLIEKNKAAQYESVETVARNAVIESIKRKLTKKELEYVRFV